MLTESFQHNFGGTDVGSQRDALYVAETEQGGYIRLVRLCSQRIAEKQNQVNFVVCNSGTNLLVTALGTG